MKFALRRNRLTTHFSECIRVVKRRMAIFIYTYVCLPLYVRYLFQPSLLLIATLLLSFSLCFIFVVLFHLFILPLSFYYYYYYVYLCLSFFLLLSLGLFLSIPLYFHLPFIH